MTSSNSPAIQLSLLSLDKHNGYKSLWTFGCRTIPSEQTNLPLTCVPQGIHPLSRKTRTFRNFC